MTDWKDHHERHTPFLSRGMGRVRQLEQQVTHIEDSLLPATRLEIVEQLPDDHAQHPETIYLIVGTADN